jgi:hypothetical protein
VYCDILKLCTVVYSASINKKGKKRRRSQEIKFHVVKLTGCPAAVGIFLKAWGSLDRQLSDVVTDFHEHRLEVEKHAVHSDRLLNLSERVAASQARFMQEQKLDDAALRQRKFDEDRECLCSFPCIVSYPPRRPVIQAAACCFWSP